MMASIVVVMAFLVDLVVGDPPRLPHPVVIFGKMISGLEYLIYTPRRLWGLINGSLLAVIVVLTAFSVTAGMLYFLQSVNTWLAVAVEIWIISTTLSVKGLAVAAQKVQQPLINGSIDLARQMVSRIVGRDTDAMDAQDITRATVETVAENTVDGVVAPLFYAFLGGAPLAVAYKAVNTLDSMVGYRNDRYIHFGWFSAKLDDVANYLPARICGLILLTAAWIIGRRPMGALQAMIRDSRWHPSPNSGIPEAAVAGALGVRLGGLNVYGGKESFRHYMGDELNQLAPVHIQQAVNLMYISSFLMVTGGVLVCVVTGYLVI